MTWRTDPPRPGEWLVVDRSYGHRHVATYRADLGWCIRGRWLGHDAVQCWQAIEAAPERENPWRVRKSATAPNDRPASG